MHVGLSVPGIALTEGERLKLRFLERRGNTQPGLTLRARIVLACATGQTTAQIARSLKVTPPTVMKWRRRFAIAGLAGLADAPRPGQPRKVTDAKIQQVIARTLGQLPPNAVRWSTRSMGKAEGLTQNAVWRIWTKFGIYPPKFEP